ncbi:VanZ family protein, partial [Bacillus sp. NPDC077411]
TYILENKKEVMFYSYFSIPDKGEITILLDGKKIAHIEQYPNVEPLNLASDNKISEITIIVSGNAKLWDVRFSEMKHWWE